MGFKFIALTFLILIGCSVDPNGKSFDDLKNGQTGLSTRTKDRWISHEDLENFNFSQTLGIESSLKEGTPWLLDSESIFSLAENSFTLAEGATPSISQSYQEFSHEILEAFYQNKSNATQFQAKESMYLPAALGFEGEKIFDIFKKIGSEDETRKLKQLFAVPCNEGELTPDCHSLIWPEETPNLEPKKFLSSIKNYMLRTVERMKELGVASEYVSGVQETLQTEYLNLLDISYKMIENVSPESPLSQNTNSLVQAVDYLTFLPASIYNLLSTDLVKGDSYAKVLEGKVNYSKEPDKDWNQFKKDERKGALPSKMSLETFEQGLRTLNVLGNIWLDLETPEKRYKYIGSANLVLYSNLLGQSLPFLRWVSGKLTQDEYKEECDTWFGGCKNENYLGDKWRYGYIDRLSKSCHEDVKNEIENWLSDPKTKVRLQKENLLLYKILASYQEDTLRNVILKNTIIVTDKIQVEEFLPDGSLALDKKGRVKFIEFDEASLKFDIPYISQSKDIMKSFVKDLAVVCLRDVQNLIENALNNYILATLDEEIRKYGEEIEEIVSSEVLSNQMAISLAIKSPEAFNDYFDSVAVPIMDKMLFGEKKLNGLESSRGQIFLTEDKSLVSKDLATEPTVFETGAGVLGTALAANYYRLKTLPEAKGVNPIRDPHAEEPNEYYQAVFEQINKMLSMIGFTKMDRSPQKSLSRKFFGPIEEFNVYKYDCSYEKLERQKALNDLFQKDQDPQYFVDWREFCEGYENSIESYFSIPDRLAISGAFNPEDHAFSQELSSRVKGQTEIIRGGSLMLRFFQDWNQPDDYDKGMGSELFSNVQVFPKHAFVNLTIALATAPIRGLTKLNTNLYLFDLNDSELVNWAEKGMPDQGGDSPIAFAAITDIINQVHSRVTSSEDLARFILAIDEFLSATEGIENTQATVINPPFVKEKENLNSLLEGRRLLKLMVAGVSNILTSRLQDKDGGMWDYFDLDKKEVVREERGRSLKTQLYVIEALLKNYELWGGRGAHLAALESYHFINNALFDENMGVYRAYEKEGDLGLRPQDYLQLIRVLKKISHYHFDQESKKQAERLMRFYENHWLEWIKK